MIIQDILIFRLSSFDFLQLTKANHRTKYSGKNVLKYWFKKSIAGPMSTESR